LFARGYGCEKMNRTYLFEKNTVKKKFIIMREKLKQMYEYKYPKDGESWKTLTYLESEFQKFDYLIIHIIFNPDCFSMSTSPRSKREATLDGMANVLNEFLHGVSKGFQDAAFASFSRRDRRFGKTLRSRSWEQGRRVKCI